MATENTTTASGGETPNDVAPIPGETPATPGTGETPGTTTEPSPAEIRKENERLAAALKRANAEAKEHRIKAEELDKIKAAQMTEQERKDKQFADLQKAHDDAIRQHQEYKINSEVKLQAAQMGFADIADAIRLMDWSEITYGEDGTPNNVKDLLSKLLKAKPYLAGKPVQAAPTAGGPTAPARSQSSSQQITQEYINRLTAAEYATLTSERRQEIAQWQADHMYRFGQRR